MKHDEDNGFNVLVILPLYTTVCHKTSVVGPLLFTIYGNSHGPHVPHASLYLFADDTVVSYTAASLAQVVQLL